MARNPYARIMDNNFNNTSAATITYSSQLSATYAAANTRDQRRGVYWKPSGNFDVIDSNRYIYINDGSDRTATLTTGAYATPALMATQIQTALNAVSSNWSCSHNADGSYRFRISRSGTGVLRLGVTTDAAWDMLGFNGGMDRNVGTTATDTYADETRIHTSEWYQLDLGISYELPALCVVGPSGEIFSLASGTANVYMQGDNVDDADNWASPILSSAATVSNRGIWHFIDDGSTTQAYRYWRFKFEDRQNPNGPSAFKISDIYMGDYITSTFSNISTGLTKQMVDPTIVQDSDGGQQFFSTKRKYRRFSNLSFELMEADHRRSLEAAFERLGIDQAFHMSIDPMLQVSDTPDELSAFGRFAAQPTLTNVMRDYYAVNFDFREAL